MAIQNLENHPGDKDVKATVCIVGSRPAGRVSAAKLARERGCNIA